MTTLAEHDYEPVWGLPERPPEGEAILWQGRPSWWALARHALYLPYVAAYLAVMVAARVISVVMAGASFSVTALDALWFLLPSIGVVAMLAAFAWGVQRTTAYTITSRRVVLRFGMALEMSVNLPFALVQEAGTRLFPDGSGDVTLSLDPRHRISYLLFWPHVRPWHYGRPQPALRAIPDAEAAAQVLARALAAHAAMPVQAMSPAAPPAADHGGATPQPA